MHIKVAAAPFYNTLKKLIYASFSFFDLNFLLTSKIYYSSTF